MLEKVNEKMKEHFIKNMCSTNKLFRLAVSGDVVWDLYLKNFKDGDDPIFLDPESSVHNCNYCKNFIRRYGNVVAISSDLKILTIFDVNVEGTEFQSSFETIRNTIKEFKIENIFFESYDMLANKLAYEWNIRKTNELFRLGNAKNVKRYTKEEAEKFGVVTANQQIEFKHFHLDLPKQFVNQSSESIESIQADYRDNKNVLKRGLDEIPLDTLNLILDLIAQGSLLNGATYTSKVANFKALKEEYDTLSADKRDNWCWIKSYQLKGASKFKNELIGVLASDLAQGVELNKACQDWNKRVDPANYMKAVAPITKAQIELAKKFVQENGYEASFTRRFATLTDIKVSEIKHINSGDGKIKEVSVFDSVKPSTPTRHKKSEFDGVEEVSIEKFMNEILPNCSSVEAFLRNSHEGNMVTLTTSVDESSKPIFKWTNNYSWTYNGNLAGKSEIKEVVKSKGGLVEGVLRFSIAWNQSGSDNSDLDAWCIEPDKNQIGFSTEYRKDTNPLNRTSCSGQLDVDIVNPSGKLAVENIAFSDLKKMKNGEYLFYINMYSVRSFKGFQAEIEFDGQIFTYEFSGSFPTNTNKKIATVTVEDGKFSIVHHLPSAQSSKEIYGISTEEFHKVKLICLSPNYWGDNNVGHKHYLFMLENCVNPAPTRTFHNENLTQELLEHRKVLDVLGSTTLVTSTNKEQLSGIGYNATVRDELLVRVSGSFKRMLKIKF